MKIETQVINEITGAMKVVGENGPQSVIEYRNATYFNHRV
jgi:hypothetical protein